MHVRFLKLEITDDKERKEILDSIEQVFLHGKLINGPELFEFEKQLSQYLGVKHASGVASGSDSLIVALNALNVGSGDEVITTSLSWVSTPNSIMCSGATPVFADICDDQNIDPESVKRLITKNTKAIMPVHFTGKMANINALSKIASENGLLLIEDASQAFGASKGGRFAGTFGDAGCISMNSMKLLASMGEAGAVVTNSDKTKEMCDIVRYCGTINKEECIFPSLNHKMDGVQAAVLLNRLKNFSKLHNRRNEIAAYYSSKFKDIVDVPLVPSDETHAFYTYTIQTDNRDELHKYLEEKGIETKIHYKTLLPHQPVYNGKYKAETANAERIIKRVLSLPVHEKLSDSEVQYVTDSVLSFFRKQN